MAGKTWKDLDDSWWEQHPAFLMWRAIPSGDIRMLLFADADLLTAFTTEFPVLGVVNYVLEAVYKETCQR